MSCRACLDGSAEDAWERLREWKVVASLVEESHFIVSWLACAGCGQQLLKVFCERIDWQGGEDPQAWVVIPISPEEGEQLRALDEAGLERAAVSFSSGRRCLSVYHPSDGPRQIRWTTGPVLLMRHD